MEFELSSFMESSIGIFVRGNLGTKHFLINFRLITLICYVVYSNRNLGSSKDKLFVVYVLTFHIT